MPDLQIHVLCDSYAVFTLEENNFVEKKAAENLLRRAMCEKHLKQWENIHFEVFCGKHGTLYLAFPENGIKIHIAPYALPFLNEYFTE